MIEITRALARQFRTVLRRALSGLDTHGACPLVVARTDKDGLTLQAYLDEVGVRFQAGRLCPEEVIVFRGSVLTEFEGRNDDPVRLEQLEPGRCRATWTDGGVPRVTEFDTTTPDQVPPFPELPRRLVPLPAVFLEAMDEAVRTTAKESVRYAVGRVQLRGRTGEVVATDGKQLLVQRGFEFPWQEDLLVPRVGAFACRELDAGGTVGIGRTKSHVVVQVGAWTFVLAIDAEGRYPNVNEVVPRPGSIATRLHLHPEDAAFLTAALPKLPGSDDPESPITLDLSRPVAVRAKAEQPGRITEVVLARSEASGPPVRFRLNRRFLHRALKLGFGEIHVGKPEAPILCEDDHRRYVVMPLGKDGALPPTPDALRITSAELALPSPLPEPERSKPTMPAPQPYGHKPVPESATPNEPERLSLEDVIAETEALRALLQEASGRTARLLAALKHQRRQSRAVRQAMESLRQLQLGG